VELDPQVRALGRLELEPGRIAPDQTRVLAGLRRDDLFTVVLEQFMTDTAAHADVVLPAPTQLEHRDVLFSWDHHYVAWNEPAIEPRGEAKPNTETFRLLAARLGLDDPCFSDSDEELIDQLLEGFPSDGLRERGWVKVDLGQGETPHAEGNFVTEADKLIFHADYEPPAEVADAELAGRFPVALVTPKTHLFLNSTFANQQRQHSAQPRPEIVLNPEDAAARGSRTAGWRGSSTTAASSAASRACRTPPGPAWWLRRWVGGTPTIPRKGRRRPPRHSA